MTVAWGGNPQPENTFVDVDLSIALLCCSCEHIVLSKNDICPVCGDRGLLNLANVLGILHPKRGELIHFPDNGRKDGVDGRAVALEQHPTA